MIAKEKIKSAGPKPVHLKRKTGNLNGRDAMWAVMRKLKQFTVKDIENETRDEFDTIRSYITGLNNGGYIKRIGNKEPHHKWHYKDALWQLIKDVGVERPHVDKHGQPVKRCIGREQMWRAMKMIGEFNKHELTIAASTDDYQVKPSEAQDYIKHLYAASYLLRTKKSTGGTRGAARYRLLPSMNTGPRPPMIQKVKQVYDPNLGKVVYTWHKEEEDA